MNLDRIFVIWIALPALAAAALLSGCASAPVEVGNQVHDEPRPATTASIEVKQVAAEQESPYVVEIEFQAKAFKMGRDAKSKVLLLYKSVSERSRLKSIKVIAWADEEYPSAEQKKLSSDQMKLAKQRSEEIQNFLKRENRNLKFELYNMAERPGKFNEFLGGSDAEVKDSLERAGTSVSKKRKAIVMLVMAEGKS